VKPRKGPKNTFSELTHLKMHSAVDTKNYFYGAQPKVHNRARFKFLWRIHYVRKHCGRTAEKKIFADRPLPVLPEGIFSNQKSQCGQILQGLAMKDVCIFMAVLSILRTNGLFCGY
jgi:hypothetical protein